jgi:succinate dehydrogenase / fumarate reductase cytochrome b subunit
MTASAPAKARKAPKHLDLTRIRFPVTAVLSIGHRASGVLLFLATPFLLYALGRSLASAEGYAAMVGLAASLPARLVLLVLLWAFVHHLLAGLRYLVLDAGYGEGRALGRATAWGVFALEALAVLALGVWLL